VFFTVVYVLYLALPTYRQQNLLLLLASYYFYSAWDWRFLFLLLWSTLLDYGCGLGIDNVSSPRVRKVLLVASIVGNLTLLGFFKYFKCFLDSLEPVVGMFGFSVEQLHLHIVLPVGISFYTLQEMSYTIDVYRGRFAQPGGLLISPCLWRSFHTWWRARSCGLRYCSFSVFSPAQSR
jgi:alginate O-acetyltransferase complex protein AlgI